MSAEASTPALTLRAHDVTRFSRRRRRWRHVIQRFLPLAHVCRMAAQHTHKIHCSIALLCGYLQGCKGGFFHPSSHSLPHLPSTGA